MAQTVSVGLHQKVTPPIMAAWAAAAAGSGGGGSRTLSNPTSTACGSQPALLKSTNADGAAGTSGMATVRCRSPVSSSLHSSSVCSPPSESKWTSFDDESEEEAFSERVSNSDQHGLLPLTTDDGTSEGDENLDDSLMITGVLRSYYSACFDDLLEKTQGKADRHSAVRGQDAGVFDFFLKSKLPREDLGKVWKLADVNEDGYLNLEEFCVAMHLIVRRVKGNFPIPDTLPASLMPPKTPPRNVTPCARDWTDFDSSLPDRKSSSLPRMRVNSSAPGNESPLKDFTDCLALSTDRAKSLACPVACRRVSPSDGENVRVAKYGGTAAVGRSLVISPQAPKGPPPKPPPRPVVRHVRSASLDLTKNSPKQSYVPPPSAPAPQLPLRNHEKQPVGHSDSCEVSMQTDSARLMAVSVESTSSTSSSIVKVVQTKRTEDKAIDNHTVLTLPDNCATAVQRDICATSSASNVAVLKSAATAMESKDWKKRCEDTNRLNALLERELKQLMELRIGLESDLNQLRKHKRVSPS